MRKAQLVIFMLFAMLTLAVWNTGYRTLLKESSDPVRREKRRSMNYGRRAFNRGWFFTNHDTTDRKCFITLRCAE